MKHGTKPMCVICLRYPRKGSLMCGICGRAYDRHLRRGDDGTVYSVIFWAATRARRFERERAAKPRGAPFTITSSVR